MLAKQRREFQTVLNSRASLSLEQMSNACTCWTDVVQSRVHVGDSLHYVVRPIMKYGFFSYEKVVRHAMSCVNVSSDDILRSLLDTRPTCNEYQRFVRICMCSVRHFFDIVIMIELFYRLKNSLHFITLIDHRLIVSSIYLHCTGFWALDGP